MQGAPTLIGTAGWSIPRTAADGFPADGTHLQRYARVLPVTEINSTFHRPHGRSTFERWAASTPEDFRFSVKLPKEISHTRRLIDTEPHLDAFCAQVGGLGDKLGVMLLQMPPSLGFDAQIAAAFLAALRQRTGSAIACEPRHPSWFGDEADACLAEHRVARVAADPPLAPGGGRPGGWPGLRYHRLHGAPRVYYSAYDEQRLDALAHSIRAEPEGRTWCIFDNTAAGAATANALRLDSLLEGAGQARRD
jgi:uncharacterized protein YecE (DUF72 family)